MCHCNIGSGRSEKSPAFHRTPFFLRGTLRRSWLTHCPTTRKVAVSFPDAVIGNFLKMRLRGLRVRISPEALLFVASVVWCAVGVSASADREASLVKKLWPTMDCCAMEMYNPSDGTTCPGLTQSLTEIGIPYSVEQKSIGVIFRKSRSGSDVRYSCHHNSSRFSFPIFAHSWRFSVFRSLEPITLRIY